MTSKVFTAGTVIDSDWLNDVNTVVYSGTTTSYVSKTSDTGSIVTPVGTTAQRDATPLAGYLRYNTTTISFEGYNGTIWGSIGGGSGGATGGGTDDVFYENGQTVTTDYTLTTNKNAMSAGTITINSGVTVTIPSGATWSIV
jgi:inosine/xanthosine triphosphate pyrophosphatase family protein